MFLWITAVQARRATYRSDMDAIPGRIQLAVALGARVARVALPDRLPVAELLAPLARHFELAPDGRRLQLRRVDGPALDDARGLAEQGLRPGDLLLLESEAPGEPWVHDDLARVVVAAGSDTPPGTSADDLVWRFGGWLLLTSVAVSSLARAELGGSRWPPVVACLGLALATVLLGSAPVLAARFGGIDRLAGAALADRPSRSSASIAQAVRQARRLERRLTGAAGLAVAACAPPALLSPGLAATALAFDAATGLLLAGYSRRQASARWAARLDPLVTAAALPLAAWATLGSLP